MIDKIKGLIKYTDCSMPKDKKELQERQKIAAYNQAILDVVELFTIHNVSKPLVHECKFEKQLYPTKELKCKCGETSY